MSFCIELFCVVTLQYQILVRIAIAYFIIEKRKAAPQPWQAIAQRFCSTLDLEESIDLQWQKDKFQLFLKANEDNIEKSKPLVFYVNDSTGKQYTVKTKKNASCYFKE